MVRALKLFLLVYFVNERKLISLIDVHYCKKVQCFCFASLIFFVSSLLHLNPPVLSSGRYIFFLILLRIHNTYLYLRILRSLQSVSYSKLALGERVHTPESSQAQIHMKPNDAHSPSKESIPVALPHHYLSSDLCGIGRRELQFQNSALRIRPGWNPPFTLSWAIFAS